MSTVKRYCTSCSVLFRAAECSVMFMFSEIVRCIFTAVFFACLLPPLSCPPPPAFSLHKPFTLTFSLLCFYRLCRCFLSYSSLLFVFLSVLSFRVLRFCCFPFLCFFINSVFLRLALFTSFISFFLLPLVCPALPFSSFLFCFSVL